MCFELWHFCCEIVHKFFSKSILSCFFQCVLDYVEGFLVIMAEGKLSRETAAEVGYLGALLHKANEMIGTPTL